MKLAVAVLAVAVITFLRLAVEVTSSSSDNFCEAGSSRNSNNICEAGNSNNEQYQ